MFRKHLISSQTSGDPVSSGGVPRSRASKTFPELMVAMHGFFAFGICFTLLANVWYQHYRFFRRYALETPWVVFLNCALLFFVLFYVYPLKFLFTTMFERSEIEAPEARALFTIWSPGYAAVFAVFALLYLYAWRIRHNWS
jgi:uncharacterized membrane protein